MASFNWADPRRNSSVSTKMMEKAEAARKQRLTKVKPSVSTHLNPAVEKKLPKKQHEKQPTPTEMYMESLESATINDSFYNSLLKFHSNQESPLSPPRASASSPLVVSPFSVHNVVATDSFFHPESEIEAFQGLKKGEMSPPPPHAQPRSSSIKPSKRGDKKDVRPLPSRSSMSRADKLPALKSTVTKRDVHMTSTRSNPDLALYADPRRRDDLLDLFDSDDAVQTTIHRSESAPSASSTITHSPDRDSPATTPNLTPNGHATNHGDGAVVPRLNFNPFTSRESKTTIMHHESKKASADHGKTADQKRTHKANPKAGKKDSGRIHTATGTSLADLRDEHKAALELLQELGGAYPDDAKPSSSRFGSKLRSTVLGGRDSNNDHTTTAYVDAALKAADVALNNRVVEIDDEVPEAESPGKEVSTADSNSARTSRRSEPSYDSEDFETD